MYSIARQITRVVIPDGYLERSWACVVIGVVGLLLS